MPVQRAHQLDAVPTHEQVLRIAEQWRPLRMWALVLLHVWFPRGQRRPRRLTAGTVMIP
ncbi:MAG: hypothetical protein ABR498_04265 [Candidatus Dormibacteria bacterium]